MARKHPLRQQRTGTVINLTSKNQEGRLGTALTEVAEKLEREFGLKLQHEREWKLAAEASSSRLDGKNQANDTTRFAHPPGVYGRTQVIGSPSPMGEAFQVLLRTSDVRGGEIPLTREAVRGNISQESGGAWFLA